MGGDCRPTSHGCAASECDQSSGRELPPRSPQGPSSPHGDVLPRVHTPNKRFVHLDRARASVPFWAPHRPAQLVEPRPSRAITPQSEYSVPPHRSAPQAQRLVRLVEDRASGERPLRVARGALDAIPARPPSRVALAGRTHEPLRPAKSHAIRAAVRLRAESVFELPWRPRVILCPRLGSHAASILKPELSAYPTAT